MHTTTPTHDSDLVNRARSADQQALTTIYERYASPIFRYIYYRVGDPELARDLQSEVFLRMLEGLPHYEDRGWPISAWLYRIAHDRTVDCLRRRRRRPQLPLEEWTRAIDGPEEELPDDELTQALRESLSTLCAMQQQVIRMRFIDELSVPEVAEQLGRSTGAVKAIQHRGLQAMAHMLCSKTPQCTTGKPRRRRRIP